MKHDFNKNNDIRGFTLVELVTAMVILAILSIVSVNVYRGYVKNAIYTEGKTLVGAIAQAQKIYYMQNGGFYHCNLSGSDAFAEPLDIDARNNKYFTHFWSYPRPDHVEIYAEARNDSGKTLTVKLILRNDGKTDNFAVFEN